MVWGLILAVGMLAMANGAASRVLPDMMIISSEPIPCHAYLKAKDNAETNPNYVPGSFFQAQVQLIRMEPDVTTIHPEKVMLQGELDFFLAKRKIPRYAEQYDKKIKNLKKRLKDMENHTKAFVLRVVDTLEGPRPGDEIVMSVGPRDMRRAQSMLADEAKRYVLGYQGPDQYVHPVGFVRTLQEVREEKTVMGTFKKWVRWLISECDNV